MPAHSNRGGGSRFLYEPFDATDHEQKQFQEIVRGLGTPEQIRLKLEAVDRLLEEKKRRDWLLGSIKTVAGWSAVVATGWLAFKGLLTEFLTGMQK